MNTIDTVMQTRIDGNITLIACEEKLGYKKGDVVAVRKIIPKYVVKNGIRVFKVEAEHKSQIKLKILIS